MSYKLCNDSANNLVTVVASGEFDITAAEHLLQLTYKQAAPLGRNIIFDLRDITTSISESDLYKLAHTHPTLTNHTQSVGRAAVIPGPAIPQCLVDFYLAEVAALSIPVKAFRNPESARHWILPETGDSSQTESRTGAVPRP